MFLTILVALIIYRVVAQNLNFLIIILTDRVLGKYLLAFLIVWHFVGGHFGEHFVTLVDFSEALTLWFLLFTPKRFSTLNLMSHHHSRAAHLIMELHYGHDREKVLVQLNEFIRQPRSESMRINLGYHLSNSFDTVLNILVEEVIAEKPKFLDSTLTPRESSKVCNALSVFQVQESGSSKVASLFPDLLRGLRYGTKKIHKILYPFLKETTNVMTPRQPVRLSILILIDALTKFDELHGHEILLLFLQTQIFSSCLHCIHHGDMPIKKVATLILMKILMQEEGLRCCYSRPDCLRSVMEVLGQLVETFSYQIPCSQHLKYVIRCFLSLSRVGWIPRVYETVRNGVPQQLIDNTFRVIIHVDPQIQNMLYQLLLNLNLNPQQLLG
ncbi:uncharacterized protein LOC125831545 [Solanum verrucosum]|uniref:uncharacterized protein LOC125831545 n=1 Tax=Solanum verrucosum TaxID=315347 RepID=UPI0020D038D2|nr:uncharacterized protein LOC125831545 [Solanum verrucosum]